MRKGQREKVPRVVADASALLPAWLPDEAHQEAADLLIELHAQGEISLCAPSLLAYEIVNSLYVAVRGKGGSPPRLNPTGARERWRLFQELGIELSDPTPLGERAMELALRYRSPSTYDMFYVALAEDLRAPLVTVDTRLLNSVGKELEWVQHPKDFLAGLAGERKPCR